MSSAKAPIHVSLVVTSDTLVSTLVGVYEALGIFPLLARSDPSLPSAPPFAVDVVSTDACPERGPSGFPLGVSRVIDDVPVTDIVIVPAVLAGPNGWVAGRHPEVVDWIRRQHAQGATLCSACTGALLLAETGLLDGHDVTMHWDVAETFKANFPGPRMRIEESLIVSGARGEFIMSGAASSWHDLVLYLVARRVGPTAAQAVKKFLLLEWRHDGQGPYVAFTPPDDHGDAVVAQTQEWLRQNYSVANPVEEMTRRAGLPERSFKRRFSQATGYSPIAYVQNLRIEAAKARLERTDDSIDAVSWAVGYEDPAFFRRLFKRITTVTPGEYRRKLRVPEMALAEA